MNNYVFRYWIKHVCDMHETQEASVTMQSLLCAMISRAFGFWRAHSVENLPLHSHNFIRKIHFFFLFCLTLACTVLLSPRSIPMEKKNYSQTAVLFSSSFHIFYNLTLAQRNWFWAWARALLQRQTMETKKNTRRINLILLKISLTLYLLKIVDIDDTSTSCHRIQNTMFLFYFYYAHRHIQNVKSI